MDLELPEVCIVSHCCFCTCCLWPGTVSDPGLNACPLNGAVSPNGLLPAEPGSLEEWEGRGGGDLGLAQQDESI